MYIFVYIYIYLFIYIIYNVTCVYGEKTNPQSRDPSLASAAARLKRGVSCAVDLT